MHDFSMIFTKLFHLNKALTKLLKTFMEQPFCDENFIDFYSYSHVTTQMTLDLSKRLNTIKIF
ncbi:alpha-glucosidase [Streptococcus pasteurianus]|nr:alpha-glucosidase [Streptococcus pasteurianus]RGB96317.1 alpha-glucosidase [Streptococcus pasteurianus]